MWFLININLEYYDAMFKALEENNSCMKYQN